MEWLYGLEQGESTGEAAKPALAALTSKLSMPPNDPRKKILTVLANARGFSANAIAEHPTYQGILLGRICRLSRQADRKVSWVENSRQEKPMTKFLKKAFFRYFTSPPL